MVRGRVINGAAALSCVAAAVSGCGGGSGGGANGVASKAPDAVVTAASSAFAGVRFVHVAGTVTSGGTPITLDLNLASGRGGRGQMSASGLSFQIVVVNGTVYINGSDNFWRHFGGNFAVQVFRGKWLRAPETGQFAAFAKLTNLSALLSQTLAQHGTLSKGQTTNVDGRQVVALNDTTNGGTLYVATTGKPYPIELIKSGANAGQLTFDRFDQPVSLSAPPNSIDASSLTRH